MAEALNLPFMEPAAPKFFAMKPFERAMRIAKSMAFRRTRTSRCRGVHLWAKAMKEGLNE